MYGERSGCDVKELSYLENWKQITTTIYQPRRAEQDVKELSYLEIWKQITTLNYNIIKPRKMWKN